MSSNEPSSTTQKLIFQGRMIRGDMSFSALAATIFHWVRQCNSGIGHNVGLARELSPVSVFQWATGHFWRSHLSAPQPCSELTAFLGNQRCWIWAYLPLSNPSCKELLYHWERTGSHGGGLHFIMFISVFSALWIKHSVEAYWGRTNHLWPDVCHQSTLDKIFLLSSPKSVQDKG